MMSHLRDFGLISTSLWQSERFTSVEALDARLAYIWLHTGQKTCAGVMRIGPAHLFEEVDFIATLERASEVFGELAAAGLIEWQRPYTVITRFLRHNPVKSFKHAIGAYKEVLSMPDCEVKTELMRDLQKQRGSFQLAEWRNKNDEPHDILFEIHANLSEHTDPLDTPSKPLGNPSGRSKTIKEKGDWRTLTGSTSSDQPSPQSEPSDLLRKEVRPSAAALASRLVQDGT